MQHRWLLLLLAGCGLENGGTGDIEDGAPRDTGIDGGTNMADGAMMMDVVNEPGPPQPCTT